jgi:hypothetical protein
VRKSLDNNIMGFKITLAVILAGIAGLGISGRGLYEGHVNSVYLENNPPTGFNEYRLSEEELKKLGKRNGLTTKSILNEVFESPKNERRYRDLVENVENGDNNSEIQAHKEKLLANSKSDAVYSIVALASFMCLGIKFTDYWIDRKRNKRRKEKEQQTFSS